MPNRQWKVKTMDDFDSYDEGDDEVEPTKVSVDRVYEELPDTTYMPLQNRVRKVESRQKMLAVVIIPALGIEGVGIFLLMQAISKIVENLRGLNGAVSELQGAVVVYGPEPTNVPKVEEKTKVPDNKASDGDTKTE
jgi:hypothetical protein